MATVACPFCPAQVDSHLAHCPECGNLIGFPNVRRAEGMRTALVRHYEAAIDRAVTRGVADLVARLEVLLAGALATINVSPTVLVSMARAEPGMLGNAYVGYHRALELGLRLKAEDIYHSHRLASDAKLHPGYEKDIIYAALSPDGRGLTGYGEIALRLRQDIVARRGSLLRENAFDFYQRYRLGEPDAVEDEGWRAVWADRALLGVAQLEPSLTPATAEAALPDILLTVGATRPEDRFIEVHIFNPISTQALTAVNLELTLTDIDDREDWEYARAKLTRRGVLVTDTSVP